MSDLQIKDLHKSYGQHAVLTALELTVPTGSFTAILGPSGSGKTTLLRVLAGFQRPDRGTVTIAGRVIDGEDEHVPANRRLIGYVPQEGALFPHLTVHSNVAFGLPRARRRGGTGDLLEMVGLRGFEKRYPHQLSGGQQQRVALARALAIKPELVLLDEPFASLDASLRASVREDVNAILREAGATAVLVTHDQDEALSLADRVAVLRNGRIAQCAPPYDLYAHPIDQDIARFIGEANLLDGIIEDGYVQTGLGKLLAAGHRGSNGSRGSPVNVLVRPEQIDLSPADGEGSASARIVKAAYHGHDSLIHVQLPREQGGKLLLVRVLGRSRLAEGAPVTLSVRDAVLAWPA